MVRANEFERNTGDDNIDTIMYPLCQGSEFKCVVRFHNLKHEELGALLSAITFHNSANCFHQIGQGKPYGFGKVSITVSQLSAHTIDDRTLNDAIPFMRDFEGLLYEKYNQSNLLLEFSF